MLDPCSASSSQPCSDPAAVWNSLGLALWPGVTRTLGPLQEVMPKKQGWSEDTHSLPVHQLQGSVISGTAALILNCFLKRGFTWKREGRF